MGFKYSETEGGLSDLTASEKLRSSHINDLDGAIRQFVNFGISNKQLRDPQPYNLDLSNTYSERGWVDSEHIFKPEFYGSPSPRMTAVSGATHFRETNSSLANNAVLSAELTGSTFTPSPGLCTRIKLPYVAMTYIHASFYAYELGGLATPATLAMVTDPSSTAMTLSAGYLGSVAAKFQLLINGNTKSGTTRDVHTSSLLPHAGCFGSTDSFPFGDDLSFGSPSGDLSQNNQLNDGQIFFNMLSRQQFTIQFAAELQPGIHDIGIACKAIEQTEGRSFVLQYQNGKDDSYMHMKYYGVEHGDWPTFPRRKHIFVGARNLVVDSYYSGKTSYQDF